VKPRIHLPLRLAAVAAAVTLTGVSLAPAAYAADGDVEVVNTETVQVYTDATGAVQTKRVYEQVAMTGRGTVDLANPIETNGLRNLDGFGGFDVEDGKQLAEFSVDGEQRLRTVSTYDGDLPLEVEVQYFLNDKRVEPGDIVGASGKLTVQYRVKNVTASPQEVTFTDGSGGEVTKTIDVPIPMVGSLTTTAPSNFTDVQSDQANIAGDGKGGTKLSFTMTLFPPLGSDTAEFGYTAHITDGVIPRADISALPVNPLASPTFKTAAESYEGGATTGETLADGADQIDTNLLKLRDGAGDLLAGLIQLRDGSNELRAGLAGEAAPGARQLADGAGELDAGLGQINSGARRLADGTNELFVGTGDLTDGTGRLKDGANKLADGAGTAADGGRQLRNGAGDLSDGLGQLKGGANDLDAGATRLLAGQTSLRDGLKTLEAGVKALPASVKQQLNGNADYQTLLGTLDKIVVGIGDPGDASSETLLGGLNLAAGGASQLSTKLSGGVANIHDALLPAAIGAYDGLVATAGCPVRAGSGIVATDGTTQLPPASNLTSANPACRAATVAAYGYGIPAGVINTVFPDGGFAAQADAASKGAAAIATGLTGTGGPSVKKGLYNSPCDPTETDKTASDYCGLSQAVSLIRAGVPVLIDTLTNQLAGTLSANISVPNTGCDPAKPTLLCGAGQLVDGTGELKAGTNKLAAGAGELDAGGDLIHQKLGELAAGLKQISGGAFQLADGTEDLDAGAGKLRAGAGQLNDGAGQLADGTGEAKDGTGRLADGAGQLADGLGDAADGSGRLADGLTTAADGAPKLVDGAERLSNEGTKKLVEAGEDTAQNYGEMYATIAAGSGRAQTENMAYGAPEGAMGLTAYSFVIEGENGEGGRNVARGVAGLAILGAGAGAFALRRRFV
jgi:putative membrane protein